jgi:hypothetical protein
VFVTELPAAFSHFNTPLYDTPASLAAAAAPISAARARILAFSSGMVFLALLVSSFAFYLLWVSLPQFFTVH